MKLSKLLPLTVLASSCLIVSISTARADITPQGDVFPENPLEWDISTIGYVGNTASGTLTVDGGSSLLSSECFIGNNSDATGLVRIDGAGSSWTNSGDLHFGYDGTGTVTQTGGTVFVGGTLYLGYNSAGNSTYNLNGGTLILKWLDNSDGTAAFNFGGGTLQAGVPLFTSTPMILTGTGGNANVNTNGFSIAFNGFLTGTGGLTKSGAGTLTLYAGNNYAGPTTVDAGTLRIISGGGVHNSGGYIGYSSGSTGSVTVDGVGSNWTNSGVLHVGGSGSGTLWIANGSSVSDTSGYLGDSSGSTGVVTLKGSGSAWTNSSDLYVGYSGSGSVTQSAGTNTISNNLYLGKNSTSDGTYNLRSTGLLNTTYQEFIGFSGTGTFNQTGGTNTIYSGTYLCFLILGCNAGSTGVYNLSGTGQLSAHLEAIGNYGAGTFTQTGGTNTISGGLSLGYSSGSNGTYNLNGGTLILPSLGMGDGTATFNFGGGILQANGSFLSSLPMTLTGTGGNANVNTDGYAVELSGLLTGTGGLTKSGADTLTLSAENEYAGPTTVNAGVLAYGTNNVISSGSVAVSGGTLSLGAYSDSVGPVTLASGAIAGGTLTSTSGFEVQSGAISSILAGSVGLTKTTAGTVTLSSANTYSGATNVGAGVLACGDNNAISGSSVTVSGGTLSLGAYSDSVGPVTLASGAITGGTLTSTSGFEVQTGSASAVLAGGVGLTKTTTGIVTLSGANAYTGATTVGAGILLAATPTSLPGYNSSGSVSVANAAAVGGYVASSGYWNEANFTTLRINANWTPGAAMAVDTTQGSYTYTSGINDGGVAGTVSIGLTKTGHNTLTLSGANTYTGVTTIKGANDGQLILGPLAHNAVIGTDTVIGHGGGADIQAGKITFDGSTAAEVAQIKDILTAGYNGGVNPFNIANAKIYSTTGKTLGWKSSASAPYKVDIMATYYGDLDLNGTVNLFDLGVLLGHYNQTGQVWATGDVTYDGTVNASDLVDLLAFYNQTLPAPETIYVPNAANLDGKALGMLGAAGVKLVPEPGTIVLLVAGLLGLLAYAWRKRK